MNTDQRFEERLLGELQTLVLAEPPPLAPRPAARGRHRLALAGGLVSVLAVAAVAGVGLLTGGAQPAYAVTANGDGTVTVEINSLRDASGLEARLREVGVPAVVQYLAPGTMCKQPWYTPAGRGGATQGGVRRTSVGRTGDGQVSFTISDSVPAGETLVVTTQVGAAAGGPGTPNATALGIGFASGEVPPCQVVDAPAGSLPLAGQ